MERLQLEYISNCPYFHNYKTNQTEEIIHTYCLIVPDFIHFGGIHGHGSEIWGWRWVTALERELLGKRRSSKGSKKNKKRLEMKRGGSCFAARFRRFYLRRGSRRKNHNQYTYSTKPDCAAR